MSLYDDLPVFKASYDLLLNVFQFTANFPNKYYLKNGLQRLAAKRSNEQTFAKNSNLRFVACSGMLCPVVK
jgi:hypothetical protein